jgi:DNA-binding response OmpR family regulator
MPPRTVLIADPAPEVRSFVRGALDPQEYRVLEARGGLEALSVCACHPVDLLLVAADLPAIGGQRLAQKLSYRFPGLRVLFLSDAPGAASAQDTIAKPLSAELLQERIRQTLDLASVRKSPATQVSANGTVHRQSA